MWAIMDFAGRYFSDDGWTDRTRDALLYATCDEAERSMQENGIVDAYCIVAGGGGNLCETCVRWDADRGTCGVFPEKPEGAVCAGYEYAGAAEKQGGAEESVPGKRNKDVPPGTEPESPFTYDPVHCDFVCKGCGAPLYMDVIAARTPDDVVKDVDMRYCPLCGYPAKLQTSSMYGEQRAKRTEDRYKHGDVECIDAIRAALTPEEFRGFCKGNVLKYVWRERHKGGDCDLDKARDYVGYAVEGDIYGEL